MSRTTYAGIRENGVTKKKVGYTQRMSYNTYSHFYFSLHSDSYVLLFCLLFTQHLGNRKFHKTNETCESIRLKVQAFWLRSEWCTYTTGLIIKGIFD